MRHTTAAVDRALTAIVAVALLLGGGSILLWRLHISAVRELYRHADRNWYVTAAQQHWWSWALAGVTAVTLTCGVALLAANLRPNRLSVIELPTGGNHIDTSELSAGALAGAVAAKLARHPGVHAATGRAVVDRGLRTLRITITAEPDVSLDQLRKLAADSVDDVVAATDNDPPATQFLVHLDKRT